MVVKNLNVGISIEFLEVARKLSLCCLIQAFVKIDDVSFVRRIDIRDDSKDDKYDRQEAECRIHPVCATQWE